jgi:mannose-1-phosphate guanylyltransferase
MKQIILAGGLGKRTWDVIHSPKQFFLLDGKNSCFVMSIFRALKIVKPKDIIITLNRRYLGTAISQIKNFFPNICSDFTIIVESEIKNTLAPIFYSLLFLEKNELEDQQIIISPCDHLIRDTNSYKRDIENVIYENDKINFLCIQPSEINDQYGHIILDKKTQKIKQFIEKPNAEKIQNFIDSKEKFFWNSGIYVVNGKFLLQELKNFLNFDEKNNKNIKNEFLPIEKLFFSTKIIEDFMPNVSIDLFLQKNINIDDCYAHQINFDWLDIGCPKKFASLVQNNSSRVCSSAG